MQDGLVKGFCFSNKNSHTASEKIVYGVAHETFFFVMKFMRFTPKIFSHDAT